MGLRVDQAVTLYGYMLENQAFVACANLLLGYGRIYSSDAVDGIARGEREYRNRHGKRPNDDAKRESMRAFAGLLREIADGLDKAAEEKR